MKYCFVFDQTVFVQKHFFSQKQHSSKEHDSSFEQQ
jgi:hypothetical protein